MAENFFPKKPVKSPAELRKITEQATERIKQEHQRAREAEKKKWEIEAAPILQQAYASMENAANSGCRKAFVFTITNEHFDSGLNEDFEIGDIKPGRYLVACQGLFDAKFDLAFSYNPRDEGDTVDVTTGW